MTLALASVAPSTGVSFCNQRVVGLIPRQAHRIPCLDAYGKQPINASLLHQYFSVSPPSSLSKSNEKMSSGEDKKNDFISILLLKYDCSGLSSLSGVSVSFCFVRFLELEGSCRHNSSLDLHLTFYSDCR